MEDDILYLNSFLCNATGAKVREETLDGRKYLVAPTVMITRGIHSGNMGPVFYGDADLSATPLAWNLKPVVFKHPVKDSLKGYSAASKTVIEKTQVGILLNTAWDAANGRLPTESWIDIEKADRVDSRIVKRLREGKPIEGSTGMGFTLTREAGTHAGRPYSTKVTGIQPDHYAILLDEVGACGVAQGAGLLINTAEGGWQGGTEVASTMIDRWVEEWQEDQEAKADVLLNAMSYQEVTQALRKLLRTAYGKPGEDWYGMVLDVYPDKVLYQEDSGSTYAVGYAAVADGSVTLTGKPEPVRRVFQYADAAGKIVTNSTDRGPDMDRTKLIADLITNGVFKEADRKTLEGTDSKVLEMLATTPAKVEAKEVVPPPVAVVTNKDGKSEVKSLEQYLADAPPAFRTLIVNAMNSAAARKTEMIEVITNMAGNVFTAGQLSGMDDDTLAGIVALAPAEAKNVAGLSSDAITYFGSQGGPAAVVTNKAALAKPPALLLPGRKKAAAAA